MKKCVNCSASFQVSPEDEKFLENISPVFGGKKYLIPSPTFCPDCRQQRRLAFRNERSLFRRKCDFSGKPIVSIYHPENPMKVYAHEIWWSEEWDALSYGRNFDFSRSFFDQMKELIFDVPRMNLSAFSNENSEYVHLSAFNKNCYLVFAGEYNEDSMYSEHIIRSSFCFDGTEVSDCHFCYDCVNIENSYQVFFSQSLRNCSDSFYLANCQGCNDCIMCSNLVQKSYCIKNVKYSKEEYQKRKEEFLQRLFEDRKGTDAEFAEFKLSQIQRASHNLNSESCIGDYLVSCKNCTESFDCVSSEDCRFTYAGFNVKDLLDVTNTTENELAYDSISVGYRSYNTIFTQGAWTSSSNILYSYECHASQNCFGCVGLKNKRYCILNTQYSKEEYENLVPRIIDHMKKIGEFGEFFPVSLSPFAYNETIAQQHFPLSKEEVTQKNWLWREEEIPDFSGVKKKIPASKLPCHISEIPDDILNWAIICEESEKPFKIQKAELEFYRKMNLPIPHFHPDVRYKHRMALRNPRKLWNRNCTKCQKEMETTYAPERPEMVYCEECYLKEVY
ncbi:hypothetical protein HZA38_05675 [Candidatus Peregrinibacteria bacterium]|nr:hypothetical protein [Candidatus Peregrinibacteria bacterium]